MHVEVMESLEEYLAGALEPAARRQIEAHLNACEMCREELSVIEDVSHLFGSLRSEETWDPSPGFYARVMQQVGQGVSAPSFAGLFSLDLAFGRRLVFACLLTLAFLGTLLVSRETNYSGGPAPERIMAQESWGAFQSAPAQDNMLVTLTAYEH